MTAFSLSILFSNAGPQDLTTPGFSHQKDPAGFCYRTTKQYTKYMTSNIGVETLGRQPRSKGQRLDSKKSIETSADISDRGEDQLLIDENLKVLSEGTCDVVVIAWY